MKRQSCLPLFAMTTFLLAILLSLGSASAGGKTEDAVKEAFAGLQAAIKNKDAVKLWALLDSDTQADAERLAKRVKGQYKKAADKDKAGLEKTLGLSSDEFGKLNGQLLLKTKVFIAKYDEIPDSKVGSVSVSGDIATLIFLEPDGDKEKLTYTRQEGKWKVALPMPTFGK